MAMAFEDGIHDMHDPRLRPALLQLVMQAHLPDDHHHRAQHPHQERHLIGTGARLAQLEAAATLIRRHGLLSEPPVVTGMAVGIHTFHGGAAAKAAADARKGAVDAWVDRLHGLLSSPVAETRWAGVSLLGITFQEFTRQRFLESYVSWFQKLLLQLKPIEPTFIRAAVCASLNDFFTRLGGLLDYPGVRREGAALAAKLVQSLLQLLGDKDSSAIWNEAVDLLAAVLKYFPACLRQHYNNVEGLLVAQIMDADGNPKLSERCARCLALLPRAHGEASAWSAMIRRILIAVNTELDKAFAGMEDANTAEEAIKTLLPRGQDPPWPLGGPSVAANAAAQVNKRFWQQLVPRICSLLQSCHFLLVNPYPVPVPVPVVPLLAFATRILRVDGSRLPAASPLCISVSSSHQTALCSELPALHLCALDLLHSIICGARSQLLPRAAHIVHLLTDAFRRCGAVPPGLRIKLYDISRHLLISLGAGMAEALAPAVVGNALSDLRGSASGAFGFSPRGVRPASMGMMCAPGTWGHGANQRKRKEPGGGPADHQGNGVPDAQCSFGELVIPTPVQISALQALQALLTAGGAMLPDRVRSEVDSLLANVAILASSRNASRGVTFDEESTSLEGNVSATSGAFQVASYRALLASLLSPCSHRPPYLAQALVIFRKGRKEAGTQVAEVCANALLALEGLIHPRCLPPLDTPAAVASGMAAAGRGNSSGGLLQVQRLSKHPPTMGTVPAVSAAPSNLNFASLPAPPLKVSQLAVDPWAEVDTWLGYGEDLGDDWRGLLAEDLSAEGLSAAGSTFYKNDQQNGNFDGNRAANDDQALVSRGETNFLDPLLTKQEVITIYDTPMETRDLEQPGAENAGGASEGMMPMDSLRYVDLCIPTTATSMTTVFSTSGGEFSSSPKREIMELPRTQILSSCVELPSLSQLIDSEDNQQINMDAMGSGTAFPFLPPPTVSAMESSALGASRTAMGSDSDSDAIPDIVDGDPDSE